MMSELTVRQQLNAMKTISQMSNDPKVTKQQLATAATAYLAGYFDLENVYRQCLRKEDEKSEYVDNDIVVSLQQEIKELKLRVSEKEVEDIERENAYLRKRLNDIKRECHILPRKLTIPKLEIPLPPLDPKRTPRLIDKVLQNECHRQTLRII